MAVNYAVEATTSLFVAGISIIILLLCSWILPPQYPRNIPSVPFWVSLLPLFGEVDQEVNYHRYIQKKLQKHGAIKIFFGGQWNLLVQRSSYLREILKDEDTYHKSGNQKKIPRSLLAAFLGDNVISSRGADWKLYHDTVKPGLQQNFEVLPLVLNARELCSVLKASQEQTLHGSVPIQDIIQRYTISNVASSLFQSNLNPLRDETEPIHIIHSAVKREIFKPIFMSFPVLDRFRAFIPSRAMAAELVANFSRELERQLIPSNIDLPKPYNGALNSLPGRLLHAREEGLLTQRQFRDNLNVLFVAAQENPQLSLISTMYLLGKYTDVQARLRTEVAHTPMLEPTHDILDNMPVLFSIVLESLRLFPPISQLINRRVSKPTLLGGKIYIPPGTYVGYNCYATNRDPEIWGKSADEFLPQRWGSTVDAISKRYRKAKAQAEFISFHGGKRACLGERFALLEIKVSLYVLVQQLQWRLDPEWPDRKMPAGPLFPRALRLIFEDAPPVEQV